MLAQAQQLWAQIASDPVVLYSLAAAVLLACVSLWSGLARGDAAALGNPRILVRVLGAVAFAFVLRVVAESAAPAGGETAGPLATVLPGLHRFPLYLVALAYGPTTGLITGLLFAAFASSTLLPGAPEAVLVLELAVLGWLAIYPSPRNTRWAGPLNAALAYVLAWGTAGVALLALGGTFITFEAVLAEHLTLLPGLAVTLLLLPLVGPAMYRAAFPRSRIGPEYLHGRTVAGAARDGGTTSGAARTAGAAEVGALQRRAPITLRDNDTVELIKERRHEPLRPAFAAQFELGSRRQRPTRTTRRLTRPALPEDELVR